MADKANATNTNHAETIRDLTITALRNPATVDVDMPKDGKRQFLMLPRDGGGYDAREITPEHTKPVPIPSYVTQNVTVKDEASLIAYLNRFKNEDSMLFGDIDDNQIKGVIDYHKQPLANATDDPEAVKDINPGPQLLAHNVLLDLPFSEEWVAWIGADGNMMRQLDFVRFIEDNALDIVDPSGADLIEICRDMQGLKKASFTSVVRTESGNAERFEYTDETKVNPKGDIIIPTEFTLRLPVYFNGDDYTMTARLRYVVEDNGGLRLGIKLLRAEQLRQKAFREIVGRVHDATGLTTLYGINA